MSNPARELHSAFEHWRSLALKGNGAPLTNAIDPTSTAGAAEVMRVARLLSRIEDTLADLDRQGVRVTLYRRQLPDWVAGMVSYQMGWTRAGVTPDHVLSNEHLDEIEGLANFLDGKVYVLGGEAETLGDLLERARVLLNEDAELDPRLAAYLRRLIDQIQAALEDETLGFAFDYGDAVQRLWVAFRAAESASPERGRMWRDLWTQIGAGTVSGVLVQGGIIVLSAITGG